MAKMTVTRSFNGNLDTSFSTYLNLRPNNDSNTITTSRHPGCSVVDDGEISIFDAQKYFNEEGKTVPSTRVSLGSEIPRLSSSSSVDTYRYSRNNNNYRGVGARSFHATPTASSEASWNSQTGLLSNPPGSMKVNVPTTFSSIDRIIHDDKKKKTRSWFFRRRCPCPCTGGKSIQVVEEKLVELKTPVGLDISSNNLQSLENVAVTEKIPHQSDRGLIDHEIVTARSVEVVSNSPNFSPDNHFPVSQGHRIMASGRSFSDNAVGFSFPILNHPMKLVLPPPINYSVSEDPPRESLEVFRPFDDIEQIHLRDRRSFTFPSSPKSRMTTVTDDDVASDASSDLFEIESFSTQTTTTTCPVLYRRRDSLEDDEISISNSNIHLRRRLSAVTIGGVGGGGSGEDRLYYPMSTPSIAATECYEPSEASIDWSVTTAEGFDRASLTNFSIGTGLSSEVTAGDEQEHNRRKGGWNGLLLGCRCKKAVGVGPSLVNEGLVVGHDQAPTCTLVNNKHVMSRPSPSFNKPPQPHAHATSYSHSSRLFRSFAT